MATASVASEAAEQETAAVGGGTIGTTRHRPVPIKGKRRNLGRQARKRRKKYLEIEAAASAFFAAATAAAALETTNKKGTAGERISPEDSSDTKVLPTDRGYVLEGVKKHTSLSKKDQRHLMRQLGYLPGNALQVVARIEDAFSSEDMEKLFASSAVMETEGASESDSNHEKSGKSTSTTDTTIATKSCTVDGFETKQEKAKRTTTSMIQNMMNEPLVIKLYPLALRDESSSTKRRRKRRREENSTTHHQESISPTAANTPGQGNSAVAPTQLITPLMEPFPTIYWVTHPLIKALISKLELDRVNVQFEERLASNEEGTASPPPLESMKRAHRSYGKERRELLSSKDREYVKGRKWYGDEPTDGDDSSTLPPLASPNTTSIAPFSEKCGVAGIRNPKAVKCLHAHAAHYWSGNQDNLVGQWVGERLKSGRAFFQGSIEDQTEN